MAFRSSPSGKAYVSGSNSLLERLVGGQWEDGFLVANPGQIIGHKDFFC